MKSSIIKILLVMAFFCFLADKLKSQDNYSFTVQTKIEQGIIEGLYHTSNGIQTYFGIPYAKPPIGSLRWKAPQSPDKWNGVRSTKKFGPRPVQEMLYSDMRFRSDGISEDCLYLNVWTPAKRNSKGLPVLVYFYGGGLHAGDGSEPRYDGTSLAKQGIIVVTVSYRLGIFGLFAHPDLTAESPNKASGNYCLLDQAFAIQWVHDNIQAFGGDPAKITIGGESAGSISVAALMASPLAKDLIAGAIGESGAPIFPTAGPVSLSAGEKIGLEFAHQAGDLSLEQLRNLSTRDLYEIYKELNRPELPLVIDGYSIPNTLPEIFRAGKQAQIPLLAGWNSAEIPGTSLMGLPYEEDRFKKAVKDTFHNQSEAVLSLYPHQDSKQIAVSATDLASDIFIVYSTWKWIDLQCQHSSKPVYRYLFDQLRPPVATQQNLSENEKKIQALLKPVGAPHASEIEYFLGNLDYNDTYVWTEDDRTVSRNMLHYLANFIKTGDPNGNGLPQWKPIQKNDANPPVMLIQPQPVLQKAQNDARYILLDKIYKNDPR